MSIGCHSLWGLTNHIDSLRRSQRLAASISRFSAPHGVNQIALAIDGQREGAPCSLDVDGGFIDIPGPASLTSSLGSQVGGDERGNTGFPVSNRLMGELKAALQDHLRQITQTQLLPEPPEHDKQDDIGGIFQEVERGPVRSLKVRRHAEQRNVRYPSAVILRCSFVLGDAPCGQFIAHSS